MKGTKDKKGFVWRRWIPDEISRHRAPKPHIVRHDTSDYCNETKDSSESVSSAGDDNTNEDTIAETLFDNSVSTDHSILDDKIKNTFVTEGGHL